MERLIIDIESVAKARELQSVLTDLGFVKHVTLLHDIDEVPGGIYSSKSALKAEFDRRSEELESGTVKSLSIDELEARAKSLYKNRA